VGPYSLLILTCSVLYPSLALAGMVLTIRNQAAPRLVRAYVGVSSLGVVIIAAYAGAIGWLPLRTWVL